MNPRSGRPDAPPSLRRSVVLPGFVAAVAFIAAIGALSVASFELRRQLTAATDAFVEEQAIADRITRSVTRQLAVTSAFPSARGADARVEFQEAGEVVLGQIRSYLFRDLSPEQRLQVEEMREEQQRMEVAAVRASDLFARGLSGEAEASRDAMIGHTFDFLRAMDAFLGMRSADLDALRQRQDLTFTFLLLGTAALALLLLLGPLLTAGMLNRRVARPLNEMVVATGRLGEGDLSVRLPPGEDLEFRTLSDGFNRMAGSLDRMTTDLESRNRELGTALEELTATQNELIQSEKLSALGRMAAGLAHELNNPLATVLGYSQLLSERLEKEATPLTAELKSDFLAPVLQEAERAQHLVRNFLHFSRKADATLGAIGVKEALEVVVTLRSYAFQQAGLRLEVEVPAGLHVQAEPQMLQSTFLNLVNNALDAMKAAGEGALRVHGASAKGQVILVFEDQGPGFSDPDRIFEPFYTTKPAGEGTGLGLAMVHRFVTLFGGRIVGQNRPEGGARIVVTLLEAEPPVEAVRTPAVRASAALAPAPAPTGEMPAVLVVEDEPAVRTLHERLLDRLGVTVHLAESAARGREILEDVSVSAVICDVKMPGEGGLSFYRWLQTEHPGLADHFLFVSGDVSQPEIAALVAQDPERFLHKPFQITEYLERVSRLLPSEGDGAPPHDPGASAPEHQEVS